jgi:prephenate dehydratase
MIVYQGTKGSFSWLTAQRLFPNAEIRGMTTFREAFEAVEKGEAEFALLPIENTLAGTIYETLDLLNAGSLQIIGEAKTTIEHNLLGLAGADQLTQVLSHPKALAQCTKFFQEHPLIESVPYFDTAGAAEEVARRNDPACAAIASSAAAEMYGLEVLKPNIHDNAENYTRFFLLSKKPAEGKKSSLCFTLDHRAGSLAEVLSWLASHNVNLTYLVSRPLIGKPFEYLFYVELESTFPVEELRKRTNSLKVLGTYDGL